jgi:hypothetical protein
VILDEILQDLRNGMSWDDVKRKYRSQSQQYEALRIFLEEIEKRARSTDSQRTRRLRSQEEARAREDSSTSNIGY